MAEPYGGTFRNYFKIKAIIDDRYVVQYCICSDSYIEELGRKMGCSFDNPSQCWTEPANVISMNITEFDENKSPDGKQHPNIKINCEDAK